MAKRADHELVKFSQCVFGDGGHYYHEGYDRAVCSCGWRSAPSRDHKALVALFHSHALLSKGGSYNDQCGEFLADDPSP